MFPYPANHHLHQTITPTTPASSFFLTTVKATSNNNQSPTVSSTPTSSNNEDLFQKQIADMLMKLAPSKRQHDQSVAETNCRGKWQKSAYFSSQRPPSEVRLLCAASMIDFLIEEISSIISQI
ncbi:hypothetical protein RND71_031352 [Anisodus tanguticus]|uniref:Uncharacterized protein n=1 Tax=Anisodus tanguticus TaxID=243964 RepID=A0AAE1RD69_9SOLA|nr:hypothetical protein RND71_031352 [Anisodus tanguticus]